MVRNQDIPAKINRTIIFMSIRNRKTKNNLIPKVWVKKGQTEDGRTRYVG